MTEYERAYWLADRIETNTGVFEEAVEMLKKQADEIERLKEEIEERDEESRNWPDNKDE